MQRLARRFSFVAFVLAGSLLQGCGGGGGGGGGGSTTAALVSIEVSPALPSIAAGTEVQLSAVGIYDDDTTGDITSQVTWSSAKPKKVTVSTTGLAKGLVTGTAELTATFSGLSSSTSVNVTSAVLTSIQVSPAQPQIADGTTIPLHATGLFSDSTTQDLTGLAAWSSSDVAIATVSNDSGTKGVATGVAAGSATITARYKKKTASVSLAITPATLVSLNIDPGAPGIGVGTTVDLHAIGTFSDQSTQDLTESADWTSSDPSVATVSSTDGTRGLAEGLVPGGTTITATAFGKTGTTLLTVNDAAITAIEIEPANPTLADGTTLQFVATAVFDDGSTQDLTDEVTWGTTDGLVAQVSNVAGSAGLATAIDPGTCTISATHPASGKSGSTDLTVNSATLLSISLSPELPTVAKGSKLTFTATGIYSDAHAQDLTEQVTWASSVEAVAVISNAEGSWGLTTTLAKNTTVISATFGGLSGSTTLEVTDATLVALDVLPTDPSVAAGTTVAFSVVGTYTDDSTQDLTSEVTWSSSDSSIAVISNLAGSAGLATTLAPGQTTITAQHVASGLSEVSTLTVTNATLVSIAVTPANPPIAKLSSIQFTATGTFSDGSEQDLTTDAGWLSSDNDVATVSNADGSQGKASGWTAGNATISATYLGVTGSTTLTVTGATLLSIDVEPQDATVPFNGYKVQFFATGNFDDNTSQDLTSQVLWTSDAPTVGSISNTPGSQGLATGISAGTVTITATAQGVSGNATLDVTPETLTSITVTPDPLTISVGQTQQMTATGTFSGGTVLDITNYVGWLSNHKRTASVTKKGLVTGIKVGSLLIRASKGGKKDTASVTVQ